MSKQNYAVENVAVAFSTEELQDVLYALRMYTIAKRHLHDFADPATLQDATTKMANALKSSTKKWYDTTAEEN